MHVRLRPAGALCATAVLAIALLLASASIAFAAPPAHLSLDELHTMLTTGPVEGYFATVDQGSAIETIPVTIREITSDSYILFDATGPEIASFGGIVAGMSGSPIYVNDGSGDKIVGAVSYGDYFTLGGEGLATPIESMMQIQSDFSPTVQTLSSPVLTTSGLVNRVIIAPDPQNYAGAAAQGAFVAKPLNSVFIGGLDPQSKAYKAVSKELAAQGKTVVPAKQKLAATLPFGRSTFETALASGAAVCALETRGDLWVGGMGTVTYADGNDVVAFGHPDSWSGDTNLYMTNAYVDGVWRSSMWPYKMGAPTVVRGTITQDRLAGIMGVLDQFSPETTFTARAINVANNHTASTSFYAPRALVDSGTVGSYTIAGGMSLVGYNLFNASSTRGSADVTTTIVVRDGFAPDSQVTTITIPNKVDDSYDVAWAIAMDAQNAVDQLQWIPQDGVHEVDILSVDIDAAISPRRNSAEIVGVALPNGLKRGANKVQVSTLVYGVAATQTVDTTITIPAGVPLKGTIYAGYGYSDDEEAFLTLSGIDGSVIMDSGSMGSSSSRTSVADVAKELGEELPGNALTITFEPASPDAPATPTDASDGEPSASASAASVSIPSVETTLVTPWVVGGEASLDVTQISASALDSAVSLDDPYTLLWGEIDGPSAATTVTVYKTAAGSTEQTVGAFPVPYADEALEFEIPVGPITRNTSFRIHYAGDANNSPADAIVQVNSRARVSLTATSHSVKYGKSTTLKTTVGPGSAAGGTVIFEYYNRGWKKIASKTLSGSSAASCSWKPLKGKHNVRVRYLGGTNNSANASSQIAITAK